MNLVTIDQARAACRSEPEDDELLTVYVNSAEQSAQDFLDRFVYPDQDALTTAINAAPTVMTAAQDAYATAITAAAALTGEALRAALDGAEFAIDGARQVARKTYQGMVVNDAIKAGVLMIAAHRYRNREDAAVGAGAAAVEVPLNSQTMLWPHRLVGV